MSTSLLLLFYLSLGLAFAALRHARGALPADAGFSGLFWPLDFARRGIDLLLGEALARFPVRECA